MDSLPHESNRDSFQVETCEAITVDSAANGTSAPELHESQSAGITLQEIQATNSAIIADLNRASTADVHPPPENDYGPFKTFVRPMGAWVKPLKFTPPATPPEPATPRNYDAQSVGNQISSFWPTLSEGLLVKQKQGSKPGVRNSYPNLPVDKLPPPALKEDGTLRFPWAARMNQETRNLFRAAEPTYRLDGTPEVIIPSKVLMLGPENRNEYVVGQFHRCSTPPGGLIHAVVNRLWGRNCKIAGKKLGESSFLFHIPHESTRKWVIQRGVWHIDDCLLFVAPWSPAKSFKVPEISSIPVWVNLKNIPDSCYSRLGISHIASGLGEPMLTHKPRLDPTNMGEAKILVEVELDKPFPKVIALDDKQGSIFLVQVEYTWIPTVCERCGNLGHKEKRCLLVAKTHNNAPASSQVQVISKEVQVQVPVIAIDHLINQSTDASISSDSHQQTPSTDSAKRFPDSVTVSVSNQVGWINHETVSSVPAMGAVHTKEDEQQTVSSEPFVSQPQQQENSTTTTLPGTIITTNQSSNSKVDIASGSNSQFISSPLAGISSAPTKKTTTEEIPSLIIVPETKLSSADDPMGSPRSFTHGSTFNHQSTHDLGRNSQTYEQEDDDGAMSEGSANLNMSRGGRPIKPLQKFQDMEWTTVRGRGKQGRRGRGYHR